MDERRSAHVCPALPRADVDAHEPALNSDQQGGTGLHVLFLVAHPGIAGPLPKSHHS